MAKTKFVIYVFRKGRSVPVTMKAAVVEAAVEVSAGVTAADSVGVTAVAAEAVEVSVAGSAGVTAVAAEAVGVSAEVTAGVTEESPAGVTAVAAEVKRISVPSNFSMYRLNFFLKNCFFKYLF